MIVKAGFRDSATAVFTAPEIAPATTLTAAHTRATTARATLTLTLALTLPGEGIGSDIAKGGFHGIRLGSAGTFVAPVAAVIAPSLPL